MFGLSPPWLVHDGVLIPDCLVLSHDEQRDRLAADCPPALGATLVAGDPCWDRMVASRPLRETYRQAFGLRRDQRLVVVSSTWGGHSLYGRHPELIERLAGGLPLDDYRVAVALHPNIAAHHSSWQLTRWLDRTRQHGVLVLPDPDQWRQALLAASVVVGDHGSVTFYAAALGLPILLATRALTDVDPRSPIAALLRAAPLLRPEDDPSRVIEAVRAAHRPARYRAAAELVSSHPGQALERLIAAIYRLLDLSPPGRPAGPEPLPPPTATLPPPSAEYLSIELTQVTDRRCHAAVTRRAAAADQPSSPHPSYLAATVGAPLSTALPRAQIVIHPNPGDVVEWIDWTLATLPGALLAVGHGPEGTWLVGGRGGWLARLHTQAGADDGPLVAAVLLTWLATGRSARDLPIQIDARRGATTFRACCVLVRMPSVARPGTAPHDAQPPEQAV